MSAILGMIQAGANMWGQDRQRRNQQDLMNQQMRNQMGLNQQGSDLQYQQWLRTNYPKQIEMMKKAGLNPALMYAKGGPGGTTGSQTGGSATGGQAASMNPMDIANLSLMNAQRKKLEAEARNIDSSTGVNEAQTRKIGAEFKNIEQDTIRKIQETTNLKTIDEWNKVRKGLDELKESKKVTGSSVVDLMTTLGLDPVNNTEDANAVRILLGMFYGSTVAKNIMNGIGSMKGGTRIGEIFNNTNIHK
jgi:hypothetical protein